MAEKKERFYTCSFCFVISSFIVFLIIIFNYMTYDDYKLNSCNVKYIDYPLVSPQVNDSFWDICKCGRRCEAYSPIINVYVNIINHTNYTYLLKNDIEDKYTFFNKSCSKGYKVNSINIFLNNAKLLYNRYSNKTIDCYFDGNHVLIRSINVFEMPFTIIGLIIISIIGLFTCGYGIDYFKEKYSMNKIKKEKEEKTKTIKKNPYQFSS